MQRDAGNFSPRAPMFNGVLRNVAVGGRRAVAWLRGAGVCRAPEEYAAWLSPSHTETDRALHLMGGHRSRAGRASSGVTSIGSSALGRVWARECSAGKLPASRDTGPPPAASCSLQAGRDLDIWEKLYAKDYEEKSRLAQFISALTAFAAVTDPAISFLNMKDRREGGGSLSGKLME